MRHILVFLFTILSVQSAETNSKRLDKDQYSQVVSKFLANQQSDIRLGFKSIDSLYDGGRQTSLNIMGPFREGEDRQESETELLKTVGEVNLVEYSQPKPHQTHFFMNLIYVYEGNQGQGIGPKTLAILKELTTALSIHSSFYSTLGLLSQDVEYRQNRKLVPLTPVPRRVDFYMKSGFGLDPKSVKLIKFLDIGHMVRQLTPAWLAEYMCYYIFPGTFKKDHLSVATMILPKLKNMYSNEIPLYFLIQCVRHDCNRSAVHILDRAYYRSDITDRQQQQHKNYTYLMTWTVGQNSMVDLNKNDADFLENPEEFLTEHVDGQDALLADQILLNSEIRELCDQLVIKIPQKRSAESDPEFVPPTKRLCLSKNCGDETTDSDREPQDGTVSRTDSDLDQG